MKINELLNQKPLLEGVKLDIYEMLIDDLLLSEDGGGGGGVGGGGPGGGMGGGPGGPGPGGGGMGPPMASGGPLGPGGGGPHVGDWGGGHEGGPIPGGGWDHGHPLPGHLGGGPAFGGLWFNQLFASVKQLITAKRIKKRMKDIGISSSGSARVDQAAKNAAKNVRDLLSKPQNTAYNIPLWTTKKPPKSIVKTWNEHFGDEFQKELAMLSVDDLFENRINDVMALAAEWVGTTKEKLQPALKTEAERILDDGRQMNRKIVDTALGKVVIIHYKLGNSQMVRIEDQEGKIKNLVPPQSVKPGSK